jgi:hypothetical protein
MNRAPIILIGLALLVGAITSRALGAKLSLFRVDIRYSQANERYREDGQDDVAHTSLLKEEPSQPLSV